MPTSKEAADQSRKFGFKETREQYQQRKRQEKQLKWTVRLSREDLGKLKIELESLKRARFLAPQQNERKRLVQRMIRDLEAAENKEPEEETPVVATTPPAVDSDSDDDIFFAKGTLVNDEHKRLFIPRSIRRKPEEKNCEKTAQQLAGEAEKELLAAVHDDDDIDSFLDSLQ
ncbi:hypothetical protein conserved [Leishmania donovani]|uniref:Hypothetical_protein_conserved n=1 Tax=Leishmania donovani TaxID=5661 RepID=A0A3S7WWT3_LEIDO|nr:hypothetical protein, conserved [Leishmania donovani]AYU78675.1 hypothetical protein LdCL_210026700 [Leishmania donovani]TPP49424.1 hypothetical protein CGC21_34660 [Leishmania donovani]CAJ1988680.1 hypothetical protein conserved [Leishmania donovani]CBZ34022.1 hypothetical protein, conserved [Leishmania donovani]VDZ44560.1 hypothetical_protein_conserved [Leishmania donovani]